MRNFPPNPGKKSPKNFDCRPALRHNPDANPDSCVRYDSALAKSPPSIRRLPMTAALGWIIITLAFASLSAGLLYPVYRVVRRARPESGIIRWLYAVAVGVGSMVLWIILPLLVHRFFPRFAF
jgi:hypothetical protein